MDYQRLNLFRTVPVLSRPYLRASLIATIGGSAFMGAVVTFGGFLARRKGASPELLFLLSMAPFMGFLLTTVVTRLAFRIRWGALLGVITVMVNLLLLAFYFVDTAVAFVLLFVLIRTINGAKMVLTNALLKAHVREILRPQILKWLRVTGVVCVLPLAFVAGELLDRDQSSYQWLWPVTGIFGIATCVFYFRLPVRNAEAASLQNRCGILEELSLLKKDRLYLAFLLAFFVGTFAEKIAMPINPIYFADHLDLKYSEVGKALGVIGPMLAIGGYFFWAWLLRKVPPIVVLPIAMLMKAGRPLFWALAFGEAQPFWYVAAGEAFFRFMIAGVGLSALLTVLQMSDQDRVPVYVGLHFLFMGVRGIIGPIIGLALYRAGFPIQHIYWLVFGIVILGSIALVAFGWKAREKHPKDVNSSSEPDEE